MTTLEIPTQHPVDPTIHEADPAGPLVLPNLPPAVSGVQHELVSPTPNLVVPAGTSGVESDPVSAIPRSALGVAASGIKAFVTGRQGLGRSDDVNFNGKGNRDRTQGSDTFRGRPVPTQPLERTQSAIMAGNGAALATRVAEGQATKDKLTKSWAKPMSNGR